MTAVGRRGGTREGKERRGGRGFEEGDGGGRRGMERVERMYRVASRPPLPREMPWPPSVVPGSIRPHFSSCHIGMFYRHLDGSIGALTFQVDHRTADKETQVGGHVTMQSVRAHTMPTTAIRRLSMILPSPLTEASPPPPRPRQAPRPPQPTRTAKRRPYSPSSSPQPTSTIRSHHSR